MPAEELAGYLGVITAPYMDVHLTVLGALRHCWAVPEALAAVMLAEMLMAVLAAVVVETRDAEL